MKISILKLILLILISVLISEKVFSSVDACIKVPAIYPYPISSKTVYICPYYSLNLIGYNCLGNTTAAQEQYSWTNLSNTSLTSSAQNFFTSDTGRWELTLTNTSDMSVDKDTIYVKFFSTPSFYINGNAPVAGACTYQNITLLMNTPAGTSNYQWFIEGNGTALASGTTTYSIPSTSVPGGSTNYIATSDYSGIYGGGTFSCVLIDSIIAFTKQTPIVTLPKDTSVCVGQSLKIKASVWLEPDNTPGNNSIIGFQWNGAGAFTNGNDSITTSSTLGTHTYWVLGKNLLSCQTGDTFTVVVNSNLTVKLGTMATICAGDSIILADTVSGAPGPYTFTWTPSTGLNNNTTQSPTAKPSANSSTNYTVNVTDDITGCKGSASRTIKVLAPITIGLKFTDSTTCGTDSVQLKIDTLAGGIGKGLKFLWNPNTSISNNIIEFPYVNPSVATSYQVMVTDSLNCKATSSAINIDKLWVKLPNDTSSFKGDSIKLNAFNSTQPGFSYKWFDSTGAVVGTGSYLYVNTTNRYIVEVYNPVTNCFVSDTINVAFTKDLIPAVWVPNVFNPTLPDPNNSSLRVYGNGIIDSNFVFQVYDNWGQIVYESYTFTDANQTGWNGTLKNSGQELNTGVYTFTLRGVYQDGNKFSQTGTASLIK